MSESQSFDPMAAAQRDADPQVNRYHEFVGKPGEIDPAAAQDLSSYLGKQTDVGSEASSRDEMQAEINDNSNPVAYAIDQAQTDADLLRDEKYHESMPKSYAQMSLKELTAKWASAEDASDITMSTDIKDVIFDKVAAKVGKLAERPYKSEKDGPDLFDGLTEDHALALMYKIESQKDALRKNKGSSSDDSTATAEEAKAESQEDINARAATYMANESAKRASKSDVSTSTETTTPEINNRSGASLLSEIDKYTDLAKEAQDAGNVKEYTKIMGQLESAKKHLQNFTGKSLDEHVPGKSQSINERLGLSVPLDAEDEGKEHTVVDREIEKILSALEAKGEMTDKAAEAILQNIDGLKSGYKETLGRLRAARENGTDEEIAAIQQELDVYEAAYQKMTNGDEIIDGIAIDNNNKSDVTQEMPKVEATEKKGRARRGIDRVKHIIYNPKAWIKVKGEANEKMSGRKKAIIAGGVLAVGAIAAIKYGHNPFSGGNTVKGSTEAQNAAINAVQKAKAEGISAAWTPKQRGDFARMITEEGKFIKQNKLDNDPKKWEKAINWFVKVTSKTAKTVSKSVGNGRKVM